MSDKTEVAVRDSLLTLMRPVTGLLGRIELPVTRQMTSEDSYKAMEKIEVGDTLLSIKNYVASNLFIPGTWKHAAMAVDNGMVVEAIGTGVRTVSLKSWLLDHDSVEVLEPLYLKREQKPLVAGFAKSLVGLPYDDLFEFAEKRSLNHGFYCSKVIWWSADQVMLAAGEKSAFVPHPSFGVPMVLPDDLSNMINNKRKWVRLAVS